MSGLTEEYIEERIGKSAYEKDVRRSVRRFYEELDRPAAPMMAYSGVRDSVQIIENLRKKGLHAVDEADPKAADPDVFVVSATSVQAPFLAPEEALKANIMMIESVLQCGEPAHVYYSNPLTREALSPAVEKDKDDIGLSLEGVAKQFQGNRYDEIIGNFYQQCMEAQPDAWFKYYVHAMSADKRHPEAYVALQEKAYLKRVEKGCAEFPPTPAQQIEIAKELLIENKDLFMPYVKHAYEECMLREAFEKGIDPSAPNDANEAAIAMGKPIESVFHGGQQGGKPYAVLCAEDNQNFIFAATSCEPTTFPTFGSRNTREVLTGGALGYAFGKSSHTVRNYDEGQRYRRGFVYQYESRKEKQEILAIQFGNREYTGEVADPKKYELAIHNDETPVLPHQNKLEKIYLAVQQNMGEFETRLLPLELDDKGVIKDKRWRDFVELHNPVDDNLKDFMVDRRNNMIAQYDEQGAERMNRKIHYVNFGKANNADGVDKNGADKVLAGLQKIESLTEKYKDVRNMLPGYESVPVTHLIAEDYLGRDKSMVSPEYWKNKVEEVLRREPACDRIELTKDLLALGEYLAKDVRDNGNDKQYRAVKRRCKESRSSLQKVGETVKRLTVSQQPAVEREAPAHLLTIRKGGWTH